LGIQYAKAMGFRVAAVDIGPAKDSCIKMGADAYFDGASPATPAGLRKLTPNEAGAKAVIVTAGSGRAYQNALDLVAVFGTLVCVGIPPPDQAMSLHPLTLIDRGINLLGTLVGTRTETLEALEFVRRGVVKPMVESLNFNDLDNLVDRFSKVCHPCRCLCSRLTNLTRHRENWSFNSNHSGLSRFFCSFAATL
ncbi:Alcohol dehydrogenase 2, partial [Fusarium odoratissimum]